MSTYFAISVLTSWVGLACIAVGIFMRKFPISGAIIVGGLVGAALVELREYLIWPFNYTPVRRGASGVFSAMLPSALLASVAAKISSSLVKSKQEAED